ncbi:MAG: von Willebrand factor type A domain-containing protein [Verrucomicrobiales bacterium]|nr:von Willebrand factor type A domain-containing protein [Verrucomicrobiales bacterium]
MADKEDPKLTAYALNEFDENEFSSTDDQMLDSQENRELVNDIRNESVLISKAFELEPDCGLTEEQKNRIYEKTGLLAVSHFEDDLSDKLLSFDSRSSLNVSKENQNLNQKSRNNHKAVIVSLVSAAAAIVITMFVLHQNNVEPNKVANESIENEGLLSVTMIENDVQGNINKSQWVSRMNHSNPVDLSQKFRYTEPFESDLISENTINFEGYEFKNPARLENRLSIFPANIGSKSYEELRKGILAGTLPNNKKINVGELINAFGHNYSKPSSGEAFAIDSEFIYSPWSSEKCLLRIGVSVADQDNPKSNEKLLLSNVKMSVEFNPDKVSGYRLIGESDLDVNLSVERLDQDVLLAGQTVTVLYEVIPINTKQVANEKTSEIVSVSIDYKDPFDGKNKSMLSRVLVDGIKPIEKSSDDIRFAASVLGYGMILEERHDLTEATYDLVLELANNSLGNDEKGKRSEFIKWINHTRAIKQKE